MRPAILPVVLAACFLGASAEAGQTTTPGPASVAGVIKLFVTVVDRNGQAVTDLGRGDFRILEKKKELPVTFFARARTGPIVWALLSDNSGSQREARKVEDWSAVGPFFERVMRPQDWLFVVEFADRYWLDCDPTSDARQAQPAITSYIEGTQPYGGTALYDTIEAASQFRADDLRGQRVFIVVTDGDDNSSRHTEKQAIAAAVNAGAVVYCIVPPPHEPQPGLFQTNRVGAVSGRKVAGELAQATGGQALSFSSRDQFRQAFAQVRNQVAGGYTIGFSPVELPKKGKVETVKIECLRAGTEVVAPKRHLSQGKTVAH